MKLILTGKTISEEQTKEIIFRTDSTIYNKIENNTFYNIFYDFSKLNKLSKTETESVKNSLGFLNFKILDNKYFYNNEENGPTGWSYLDGGLIVGTKRFSNDIKVEEIINEFTLLSKSFPFLNIKASILKNYEENNPVFNIIVKNGNIRLDSGDITIHGCRYNSKISYDKQQRMSKESIYKKDNDMLCFGLTPMMYYELGNRIFNKARELSYIPSDSNNEKESIILKAYFNSLNKFISDEIEKNKKEIDIDKVVEKENNRKKNKFEKIREEIIGSAKKIEK